MSSVCDTSVKLVNCWCYITQVSIEYDLSVGGTVYICQVSVVYQLSHLTQCQWHINIVQVSVEYQSSVSSISLNCQGYIAEVRAKSQ